VSIIGVNNHTAHWINIVKIVTKNSIEILPTPADKNYFVIPSFGLNLFNERSLANCVQHDMYVNRANNIDAMGMSRPINNLRVA
jgi:hypothetical protein